MAIVKPPLDRVGLRWGIRCLNFDCPNWDCPYGKWVVEQTEHFLDQIASHQQKPAILMQDRDAKSSKALRESLHASDVRTNALLKVSSSPMHHGLAAISLREPRIQPPSASSLPDTNFPKFESLVDAT